MSFQQASLPNATLGSNQSAFIVLFSCMLLVKILVGYWEQSPAASKGQTQAQTQPLSLSLSTLPSGIPVLGSLVSFLRDSQRLVATTIQQIVSSSTIILLLRLNMLSKNAYVVSGSEYAKAVFFANAKGILS